MTIPSAPSVTVVGPPTKHQLALMIWLAVFPTLTLLNLTLGGWLATLPTVVPVSYTHLTLPTSDLV